MRRATLCHGRWVEGHYFLVQQFFQLLSANIVLVHCRRNAFSQKAIRETVVAEITYNRTRRIQDRGVARQAHRRDHAVDRKPMVNGRLGNLGGAIMLTYASKYGWARASSTVIRFLGSNVWAATSVRQSTKGREWVTN